MTKRKVYVLILCGCWKWGGGAGKENIACGVWKCFFQTDQMNCNTLHVLEYLKYDLEIYNSFNRKQLLK